MKDFFIDIFTYHHHFNQELLKIFQRNQDRLSTRTIPLFSHVLNAHQIWNSRILNTKTLQVQEVHSLDDCKLLDDENFELTLKILDEFDLMNRIQYRNSKGDKFENSVQEILFHIANHSTHHKGQLISDLRQQEIEPPVTDYIFYKR
ncbi:DinB family protein [Salinimicrobium soli]|uniref:DinB family protein n=1 Tax=Salinimicrobium soli TaxID=1254399 RepID=UPI003AAA5384